MKKSVFHCQRVSGQPKYHNKGSLNILETIYFSVSQPFLSRGTNQYLVTPLDAKIGLNSNKIDYWWLP